MVRYVIAMVMLASFTFSATADVPPPPPQKGFKRVPYENTLRLAADLPGYQFYAFQRLGLGGQETLGDALHLDTKKAVAVPSSSSPSVRTGIVAVPEKVMGELKSKENLARLLSRENKDKLPAGVVVYETRGTIEDLPQSDPRTKVENVITISADEKQGVKFSAKVVPAPPNPEGARGAGARSPLATLIAGIAMTLGIATAGIWYVRRTR